MADSAVHETSDTRLGRLSGCVPVVLSGSGAMLRRWWLRLIRFISRPRRQDDEEFPLPDPSLIVRVWPELSPEERRYILDAYELR